MSHFKLYVVTDMPAPYLGIGISIWTPQMHQSIDEAVDAQLAPFAEWGSVPDSEEYSRYTQFEDDTEEMIEYYGKYVEETNKGSGSVNPIIYYVATRTEYPIITATEKQEADGELPEAPPVSESRWGYIIQSNDGRLLKVFRRTNPNSKWDWYVLGGRYESRLLSKSSPGAFDRLPTSDIDWDRMIMQAASDAGARWDEVRKIVGGNKIPDYKKILDQFNGNHELAKASYWSYPGMSGLGQDMDFIFDDNKEWFNLSREEYSARVGNMWIRPYAWLQDGKWHSRGDMGWFGISYDEMDKDEWALLVPELIKNLGPDKVLSVIDCHI